MTAFFDGKFEIPHIDAPEEIVVPSGLVPFSQRQRSCDKQDFVCFYEHDIKFRDELEPHVVLVYGAMPDTIFHGLETRTEFVQYKDWTRRMKQKIISLHYEGVL